MLLFTLPFLLLSRFLSINQVCSSCLCGLLRCPASYPIGRHTLDLNLLCGL
jgi:hypothetical protein